MKIGLKIAVLLALVNCTVKVEAVSVVYNIRMAEVTKRQARSLKNSAPYITTLTFFNQARKRCDGMDENSIGNLGSFLYLSPSFYAKVDAAFGHVRQKKEDFYFARMQLDDLLFSVGCGHQINDQGKLSLSGFLGLPTHQDLSPQGMQFGTGHVGLGVQLDGAYAFMPRNRYKHAVMAAARLIHFLPRNVFYAINNQLFPFRFNLGNLIDLLFVYGGRVKKHGFEVGYNASTIVHPTLYPMVISIFEQLSSTRNTVYVGYQYLMKIRHHHSGFSCAFSYGKDHNPKLLGMKWVVTAWGAWGINF